VAKISVKELCSTSKISVNNIKSPSESNLNQMSPTVMKTIKNLNEINPNFFTSLQNLNDINPNFFNSISENLNEMSPSQTSKAPNNVSSQIYLSMIPVVSHHTITIDPTYSTVQKMSTISPIENINSNYKMKKEKRLLEKKKKEVENEMHAIPSVSISRSRSPNLKTKKEDENDVYIRVAGIEDKSDSVTFLTHFKVLFHFFTVFVQK
jgi:hypothetical protein